MIFLSFTTAFLIINLLPAVACYYFFSRTIEDKITSLTAALICAPFLFVLINYYLLLFVPQINSFILSFILILTISITAIKKYGDNTFQDVKIQLLKNSRIALLITFVFFISIAYAFWRPLTEHDTFEYINLGKRFFDENKIDYSTYRYQHQNGFYYVGIHGLSYPLIYTLQCQINQVFNTISNSWFKWQSIYYYFISIAFVYFSIPSNSSIIKWFSAGIFGFTYGIFFSGVQFILDPIRIAYLLLSTFLFISFLKNRNNSLLILIGITAGFHASLHFIGFIFSLLMFMILAFLSIKKVKEHGIAVTFSFLLFIIFGAIHYMFEIFMGDGYFLKKLFTQ